MLYNALSSYSITIMHVMCNDMLCMFWSIFWLMIWCMSWIMIWCMFWLMIWCMIWLILGILLHSSKTNTSKLKKRVKDSKPFAWIIRLSVCVGPSVPYWRHELYLELVLKKQWFLIPAVFIGSFSPFGKLGIFTLSLKSTFIGWKYNIWFWWRFSKNCSRAVWWD